MIDPTNNIIGINFDATTRCVVAYHDQSPYKDTIIIGKKLVSIDDEPCGDNFLSVM